MGEIMKEMSVNMQSFAITHTYKLKENVHFKVFKSTIGEDTIRAQKY
jgi:DNA repair protein RecN (Recombination protein N)